MSSTFLYLAIVAVWAVVLVPMWLRRDTRQHHKRADAQPTDLPLDDTAADDDEPPAYQPPAPRRRGRATVIARRRRRTSGLTLFLLLSIAITAMGLAPWWAALPSVTLLAGHLALLRVAVGIDAARRHDALTRAHARRAREAAAPPTDSPTAEVIELVVPEVFDQYADDRRAVGD